MSKMIDIFSFMEKASQQAGGATQEDSRVLSVSENSAYAEYQELKELLKEHARLYYNEAAPVISDYEYDQLNLKVRTIESVHPDWVAADSPTQVVGAPFRREAGVAVAHNTPMLSIQDVFALKDVEQWVNDVYGLLPGSDLFVEEKIDGLSMTLRYQGGKLVMGETRGDGYTGEDVTMNALCINGVPRKIRSNGPDDYLEVRGEVYMTTADLIRYNKAMQERGKDPAANARNLAAGTLRQLEPTVVKERGLSFFAFRVQDAKGAYADLMSSQGYSLDELRALGFTPVRSIPCHSVKEVLDAIKLIGVERDGLPYGIDGAVIKVGSFSNQLKFPAAEKYAAGHIAYKYPPEEKEVDISDIELGVGRTGKISFTAVFKEPVILSGTSVQRATVHNMDYIRTKRIGIGARAVARKQGDIIPAIVKVCDGSKVSVFEAPEVCPVCGQPLYAEEGAADIYCTNPNCPSQLKNSLQYFCSRDALDIKSLGEVIISDLVDQGYLRSYADIYDLKNHRNRLIAEGIIGRDRNTDKVLDAIEHSKEKEAYRFLTGLGIRNVGRVTAKALLQAFGSVEAIMEAGMAQLLAVPDIGETTASCIRSYFSHQENLALLERAKAAGVNLIDTTLAAGGALSGKTICITGTLSKPRDHFVFLIESYGGKVSGSVSKKTDYLLAGEAAGSKFQKARDLGVRILNEEQFRTLLQ